MNPDLLLPLIASVGWLILLGTSLASFRLGWGRMVRMGLVWIAIFAGLFLAVEWFLTIQSAASDFA